QGDHADGSRDLELTSRVAQDDLHRTSLKLTLRDAQIGDGDGLAGLQLVLGDHGLRLEQLVRELACRDHGPDRQPASVAADDAAAHTSAAQESGESPDQSRRTSTTVAR